MCSCSNHKKQEILRLIEVNTDSIRKYAVQHHNLVMEPYPMDDIEEIRRKHELTMMLIKRQIFKDRVDSLKFELQKLN